MVILYSMKRPIYVRPLSDAERETLEAGLRSPDAFTLRRCQIVLASDRGENGNQIARSLGCNPQTDKLPFAQEEPLAQLYGAQVGSWQAQGDRA
jgi:hypothetical protein